MNAPENFKMADGYARLRLTGQVSLQQATDIITEALAFASAQKIERLLIDTTELFGFESPDTFERFEMVEQWADTFRRVKLAIVTRSELVDPEHFGAIVGLNRGLAGNIFTSESEAVAWLLGRDFR